MIETGTVEVEGVEVFVRRKSGDGIPTVFVHGNPSHSEDWVPFMEAIEGPAIAFDLPGWGRSERPRHSYTMYGLSSIYCRFLAAEGIEEHKLVVHDWGSLALIAEQTGPRGRLDRLVLINSVPLLPGFRWHWVARVWRRRGLGELANAATTRSGLALLLRQARGDRSAFPRDFVDSVWDSYDGATRRAVLALYRSAPEPELAVAGEGLDRLDCPALVVWGGRDAYLPARFGELYAERLPNAELLALPDAGHWPWIDDGSAVDSIVAFLDRGSADKP